MTHSEFKPDAHITTSNMGGVEIMLNKSCDGVYYRFNYGQNNLEQEEIFEGEILYSDEEDRDGQSYFIHQLSGKNKPNTYNVYYLSDAIKINR